MLKRPDPPQDRHRRHRQRVKAGVACAVVEYDAVTVDFLCRTHWLAPSETHDRASIGRAIAALLADSARR
jgi:hypothetical protein